MNEKQKLRKKWPMKNANLMLVKSYDCFMKISYCHKPTFE